MLQTARSLILLCQLRSERVEAAVWQLERGIHSCSERPAAREVHAELRRAAAREVHTQLLKSFAQLLMHLSMHLSEVHREVHES